MAIESAKRFVQIIQEQKDINDRLSSLNQEECLKAAREMGLDFTREELQEAVKTVVSMEEMEQVSGGLLGDTDLDGRNFCVSSPNSEHNWVKIGHYEDPRTILWVDFTIGYDVYQCTYCHDKKKVKT